MPALALVAWGFAKSGAAAAFKWLSHRSLAELALIALAIFAVVQRFEIKDARSDAARWHKQFDAERKKLEAISSKKNEQKAETSERIKIVTKTIRDAEGRAKVIEAAPLPGECKTPSAVLQADL